LLLALPVTRGWYPPSVLNTIRVADQRQLLALSSSRTQEMSRT
jgi:hypothetical protein